MATRAAVDRYASANRSIRRLVLRDLRAFWASIPTDPTRATAALVEFSTALTATYGDIAATVAAEYFEELRAASAASGRHAARLAPVAAPGAVEISTRWAAGPLFDDKPDQALARLGHVVDRMSLQPGRDTIDLSVRSDPSNPRWARVPTGRTTCAFCLMLASRGPAYGSKRSAGGDSNKYHADCDCTPTPIWLGDELPEGYDPEALYDTYSDAAEAASGGGTKSILSELRKQQGIH